MLLQFIYINIVRFTCDKVRILCLKTIFGYLFPLRLPPGLDPGFVRRGGWRPPPRGRHPSGEGDVTPEREGFPRAGERRTPPSPGFEDRERRFPPRRPGSEEEDDDRRPRSYYEVSLILH